MGVGTFLVAGDVGCTLSYLLILSFPLHREGSPLTTQPLPFREQAPGMESVSSLSLTVPASPAEHFAHSPSQNSALTAHLAVCLHRREPRRPVLHLTLCPARCLGISNK